MDDIRASIAIAQLKKLKKDLDKRICVRDRYIEALSKIKNVIVPFADNKEFVSNYIMPIVLKNCTSQFRDEVRNKLHDAGIQTSIHYPAIHLFSIYKDFKTSLPQTEYVTDHEITLPMYAALTDNQVDYICKTLGDILNKSI